MRGTIMSPRLRRLSDFAHRLSSGALAAISIAVSVVVAGVFGLLFFLWWRKRRARRQRQHVDLVASPHPPVIYPPEVPPPDMAQVLARPAVAVDVFTTYRRPSEIGPFDTSYDKRSPQTPAWVPGSFFAEAPLSTVGPPSLPPKDRGHTRTFGSGSSLPGMEGAKRSIGSIGTMDSADSSTSLLRGNKV